MLEIKIIIEAPELTKALDNLSLAMGGAKAMPVMAPAQNTAPAPQQMPVAPQQMTPAPQQMPMAPQQTAPVPPVAPPVQAAPTNFPAPSVPLAQPPKYTTEQIMNAGATLMDAGKVNELMNLLHSFGVQAVMDLKPEQLGAFATAMRELGAKI